MNKLLQTIFLVFLFTTISFAQRTVKGLVVDETGSAIMGANVFVNAGESGTVTDFDGKFSIKAKDGDKLTISFIGYNDKIIIIKSGVDNYTITLESGVELETITITGTRGKPRTMLETAVPIDVIGAKQIEQSPQTDLAQVLQYTAPSFHSTKQNIGHGSDHIDPMALRGLGADQTLVLILSLIHI